LRDLQRQGALAVVILRKIGSHHPGFSMYIIDGSDRSDISIPVVEASYGGPKGDSILSLPNNSPVTITYRENLHKRAADTKFQVILNAILSSWEFVIIILGTYRVYQFWFIQEFTWKATAPFCCVLEVIGAMFRFGYTLVDPFYAYRMIPDEVTISMITVSFPFALSSGILLTFFCASLEPTNTDLRCIEKDQLLTIYLAYSFFFSQNQGLSRCLGAMSEQFRSSPGTAQLPSSSLSASLS
jgi:hypothetical protein